VPPNVQPFQHLGPTCIQTNVMVHIKRKTFRETNLKQGKNQSLSNLVENCTRISRKYQGN
jgi:hypothetical protein